ncbi:hypothetical protein [Burkholderia cenocepacia]|uniref:hypothetical protein n=1 Tax=Burkholderia cenocepacia TaxID=95486 RepID=UPI002B24B4FA|nr:hypothetical protein [Burkholderia cenocepacia]MEB2498628.1 hypothetical protein [Burkholderia cenocepacia]MEB2556436.1 hypothetical protein [Burkholderia cenocepacia]
MAIFGFGSDPTSGPGVGGLNGFFNGPAAYGDTGLTGGVTPNGSGLNSAMSGNLGGALGFAPTGLFGGFLPGGGMSATQSGALGGGLSGAVNGAAPIGGATMGGFNPAPWMLGAAGLAGLGLLAASRNRQQAGPAPAPVAPFGFGRPAVQAPPMQSTQPYMHM